MWNLAASSRAGVRQPGPPASAAGSWEPLTCQNLLAGCRPKPPLLGEQIWSDSPALDQRVYTRGLNSAGVRRSLRGSLRAGWSPPRRGSVPSSSGRRRRRHLRGGGGAGGLQVVLLSREGSALPGNPGRRTRGVPGKCVRLFNSKCAKLTNWETEAAVVRLRYSTLSEYNFRFRFSLNPKGKHFIRLKAV